MNLPLPYKCILLGGSAHFLIARKSSELNSLVFNRMLSLSLLSLVLFFKVGDFFPDASNIKTMIPAVTEEIVISSIKQDIGISFLCGAFMEVAYLDPLEWDLGGVWVLHVYFSQRGIWGEAAI